MCDVVYCLLVDRIMAERQVAATLLAAGAEIDLPSVDNLDALLGMTAEEASQVDAETAELRAALGLSGA